ncbi:hypothetical protein [Microlunatus panaciterrae]|uniref:hypothetical protein n=1 Tax=Microlunatus panaciterrae TaxID=400768 RepID=UPI0031CDF43D
MFAALAPWLSTAMAISLAVLGALCFATAAVLQHREVGRAVDTAESSGRPRRLDLPAIRELIRTPRWLIGLGLIGLGTLVHVTALILAPVTIVQPIGVLAVPVAVLLSTRHSALQPTRGMGIGVALSVVSIATFVWFATGQAAIQPVSEEKLVGAGVIVAVAVVILWAVAVRAPLWLRCIAGACAGAMSFGLGSALMRTGAQVVNWNLANLLNPLVIAIAIGMVVAMCVGAWSVQQAYASGPPEVVLACLTVIDPLVAVVFGIVLLGEGAFIGLGTGLAMAACAVLATVGVITLAKHHPDAALRPQPVPVTPTQRRQPVAAGQILEKERS